MSSRPPVKPLSLRGYARHRAGLRLPGASLLAVQQAAGAGRILLREDGTIDPAEADAAWLRNTDDSKRPHSHNGNGHAPTSGLSAQKERESFQRTRVLTLEADRLAGRLIDAAAARRQEATRIVTARSALLGVPSRLKLRRPHFTADDLQAINAAIREALENLADRGTTTEEEANDAEETIGTTGPVARGGSAHPGPLAGSVPTPTG